MLPEGDPDKAAYINSLDTIWNSVTEKKTYITGGIGATTVSSSSEGFGADYDLPPNQSYCEICAAIAAANWNQRMNLLHEEGKYADMVEKNLYNSILVGENLDGNRFYYSTLLQAENGNKRSEWFGCACCPPNLMRTIAALSGYMYTVHGKDLFVNMFVGSTGNVNIDGTSVGIKQETNYPWDGSVKLTMSLQESKDFAVKVRIPGWVNEQKNKTVTVKVNGTAVSQTAEKGYITLNNTWKDGDTITLDIPMEIRITESNEYVKPTLGRIAIQRGPIVYCMEKAGNAQLNGSIENFDPMQFVIPRNADLKAAYNKDLLNGIVEITGDVKYATGKGSEMIDAKLQAIPYYAWNNRGDDADYTPGLESPKNSSSKMLIWTMADQPIVKEEKLNDNAAPSVNHIGWGMGADRFADGDEGTFWNGHNDPNLQTSNQWMMYDFGEKKAEITGSKIWFYDDGGGVIVPNGIKIEYEKDDQTWAEVTPTGTWIYEKNQYNTYEFEKIVTSKIRVTMDHGILGGSKVAVAVVEWELLGKMQDGSGSQQGASSESIAKLADAVSKAKAAHQEADYTAESWSVYAKALEGAENVLKNQSASQKDVDDAQAALDSAVLSLVEAQKPPVSKPKESKLTLGLGESVSIYKKDYAYVTSDKKIVTASKSGIVKGVKTGKADVTLKNASGKEVQIIHVTVLKAPSKISKLTASKNTLKKGATVQLKVTLPKGTASKITFTSSKPKVAEVSSKGVVKAKAKGVAMISAKTFNKKVKKIKITVR